MMTAMVLLCFGWSVAFLPGVEDNPWAFAKRTMFRRSALAMSLPVALEEALVQRLPLPLAQLYRRAHNAKTPLERHQAAYYLWEAGLKLFGSVAVVSYAEQSHHDAALAERLQNLARPAVGHWWEFIRLLVPVLADAGDPAFAAVRHLVLGRTRDDLPRVAGLDAALVEALDGKSGARTTVRLTELFDRLVRYRNREFGHGAAGLKRAAFYERVGGALVAGMAQLLDRLDVLAGRRLLYLGEVRRLAAGRWLIDRYELRGESARRLESLDLPESESSRRLLPERLYLDPSPAPLPAGGLPDPAALLCLHPLLVHDPENNEVLFLNARRGRQRIEYLSYTTGRVVERTDLAGARQEFLAGVLDMAVTAEQVEQWAARSHADEQAEGRSEETKGEPRRLGEFELLSELGRGGMGVVYRAWQPSLGRQVAVKKLFQAGDAKAESRFAREIRALGRVEHPHLAKIFASGSDGEQWFYAMELVEGATLAGVCERLHARQARPERVDGTAWLEAVSTVCEEARRAEKPLGGTQTEAGAPPPTAAPAVPAARPVGYVRQMVELVRQAAEAAHALHEKGILHRDIKPGNIMVTADGNQAVLMDLGLARLADEVEGRLTRTRQFVGTLRYASPEQVLAVGGLDRRSDVYSLGATLWEVLTLRPLFAATDQTPEAELMRRIPIEEVERPGKYHPGLARDLDAIVLKCLEKDPARRYLTAQELARDLERYLEGKPVRARPVRAWERGWKWAKRRPAAAALIGVSVLMVLALVVGGVSLYYGDLLRAALRETEQQRDIARQERKVADDQRGRAEEEHGKAVAAQKEADRQRGIAEHQYDRAETLLYVNRLALAQREIEKGECDRAADILEECRWDLRGWEWRYLHRAALRLHCLRGHTQEVTGVCFSPDGKHLASGSRDKTVKVWDVQTGQQVLSLKGHTDGVNSVCFSPDGNRLASASAGLEWKDGDIKKRWGEVKVWNAQTGQQVLSLKGPTDAIFSVCFSPDGKHLAGASGSELKVWDAQTGQQVLALKGHTDATRSVCFSPDGQRLASASGGYDLVKKQFWGEVKVWDAQTGQQLLALQGHTHWVTSVCFSPDGKRLASASDDKTVRVWDADRGQQVLVLRGHTGEVSSVCFSPDGNRLASVSGDPRNPGKPGEVKLWDAQTGQQTLTLKGHTSWATSVCFSPDGQRLASASNDKTVKVWAAQTGQGISSLTERTWIVNRVCFSPDGKRIASASGVMDNEERMVGGEVKVSETRSGQEILSLRGHTSIVSGLCFSPDGTRLASASSDRTVKVWDAQTGQQALTLKHRGIVTSVCFSPDGKRLASGSADRFGTPPKPGEVKVWDARTGQELLTLQGHTGEVSSVCFSPDGKRLASASASGIGSDNPFDPVKPGEVKVWEAQTGRQALTLEGHTDSVYSVCFSPDGTRLASASHDQMVKVWDARTGQHLLLLKGHTDPVISVAFSPDGKRLASASWNQTVKIWETQRGQELLSLQGAGTQVCFSPDGQRLASARNDQTVKVWDARMGPEVLPLKGNTREVTGVAFSPDSKRITSLARAGTKNEVKAWDLVTGLAIEAGTDPPPPDGQRTALSPDGRLRAWLNGDHVQVLRLSDLARHEKEEHEIRTDWHWRQAVTSANARQWFAAAFHLHRLLRDDPDNPDAFRRRGDARAEQGQWLLAAADFAAAADRQRDNTVHRLQHAWALLAEGDHEGYQQACDRMLKDFGEKPTAFTATIIALTSALSAESGLDPKRSVELAERGVQSNPRNLFHLQTLGAALYRAGRYDDAAKRLTEAVTLHGQGGTAWTKLFLAMTQHRLGDAEKARRWLTEYDRRGQTARSVGMVGAAGLSPLPAVTWLAVPTTELPDRDSASLPWQERLIRQLLRREAETVLRQPAGSK
jgi:WD40 repeat protein/serine/threonine protein kinase